MAGAAVGSEARPSTYANDQPRSPSEEEFRIPVPKAIGGKHPLRSDQLKMRVILGPSLVKHGPCAINVSLRMLKAIASLVARVKARNASDIIESATETRESKYLACDRNKVLHLTVVHAC